jgi:uncharacterized SAM-binding protein YcdF (DUF218 family)
MPYRVLLHLFYPLSLLFLLIFTGICIRKHRRRLFGAALLFFVLISYPMFPSFFLNRLAGVYPPVTQIPPEITGIVVLASGGFLEDAALPITARMQGEQVHRIAEGVRLARELPDARLWISIPGTHADEAFCQTVLKELAQLYALNPDRLRALPGARTTRDEARITAEHLSGSSFLLVTSDYHMPRAVQTFRNAGLDPHPAPAATLREGRFSVGSFFPSAKNIENLRLAVHEYLGLFAGKL